jgi:hypothetical protein
MESIDILQIIVEYHWTLIFALTRYNTNKENEMSE